MKTKTRNLPSRVNRPLHRAEISNLKAIGESLVQTFGEHACEVIIHDLADLEHSIIWIRGDLTHRRVGGAMTDFGISKVKGSDFEDTLNYMTYTEDGRTLKSSSVFLRDTEGRPWGAFCLNLDVTPFLGIVHQLQSTLLRTNETGVVETFSDDIEVTVRNWVLEASFELGKPLDALTRPDRLRLIQILDRKGLFQMKRAILLLAKQLRVSRYTIYLDLNEIRKESKLQEAEPA